MSEMIGNFFFLNHSYGRAIPILEQVLVADPRHPRARKKLVVAYIETGRLRDGYRLFSDIFDDDPTIITNTDPEVEDCPCPTLIDVIEESGRSFDDPANRYLVLGIYSAYCDIRQSLDFFQRYLGLLPRDRRASTIIKRLETVIGVNHEHPSS